MKYSKIICLLLTFLFVFSVAAFTQIHESGTIHGYVKDEEGNPLPGVMVELSGVNLFGGKKLIKTDKNGYYRFPTIPVGIYTVSAEAEGFGKQVIEGIKLDANLALAINFNLKQTIIKEEITVRANPPTIDVFSSMTTPSIIPDTLLLTTPPMNSGDTGAKTLFNIINLAPGVDFHGAYGSGYLSPNAYQLDGINTPDSAEPDYNIVSEASVSSFGLPAEYGDFTGAVFNAITKSGSSKFSGMAEFRYGGKDWNSQNITAVPTERLYDPSMKSIKQRTNQHFDLGAQIGGPIIKDKLWFFISTEYYDTNKYPVGTNVHPRLWSYKIFTKLSFQLNNSNHANLSINYDNEKADNMIAGPQFPTGVSYNSNYPGLFINATWTSIFSSATYLDVKLGYNYKKQDQIPTAGMDVSGHYDLATGMYSQNYPGFYKGIDHYIDISAHLTHYTPEFIKGSHDIKVGVDYRYAKVLRTWGYPGLDRTFYLDMNGEPYLAYQNEFRAFPNDYLNVLAIFAQDSWMIIKNLVLNFGLRATNYRYDMPSPGPGVIFKDTIFAPRLGLTYNFHDKKTVLKLHYGQYSDRIDRYWFYGADTRASGTIYKMWNGVEFVEYNRESGSNCSVDLNTKMPFSWEFTATLERELFKNASLSMTFFYRKLARAIGPINTQGKYEKITIVNPGPDGVEGTIDDSLIDVWNQLNPGENAYLITNPHKGQSPAMVEEPEHKSQGFQIVFNKKFSHRWQAMVSYVYTSARGNIERPPLADMGKDPNFFINESGSNARYAGQPHYFKVLGNVLLPWDINFGIYFRYLSPQSYRPNFGVVLNQGYETIYAEPWGVYKLDPERNVDIELAKNLKISNVTFTLMADIYNLFNNHDTRGEGDVFGTYGDYFGKIMSIIEPRTFRLGIRISY